MQHKFKFQISWNNFPHWIFQNIKKVKNATGKFFSKFDISSWRPGAREIVFSSSSNGDHRDDDAADHHLGYHHQHDHQHDQHQHQHDHHPGSHQVIQEKQSPRARRTRLTQLVWKLRLMSVMITSDDPGWYVLFDHLWPWVTIFEKWMITGEHGSSHGCDGNDRYRWM